MEKQEVISKVIQAVGEVQDASGRSSGQIGPTTRPIGDVKGFDSLSGVESTIVLSESLGCDIPDTFNPFISPDGHRALTVEEIAESLCALMGEKAEVQ